MTEATPQADAKGASGQGGSHAGEDMILGHIFNRLGVKHGWSVEFGAWDGRHSNTLALIERGWNGLLIEGNAEKFQALSRNVRSEQARLLQTTVQIEGPDCLDQILQRLGIPADFDLLSIDIDSDDLAVWQSMRGYRAKCVVIEFNVTIPFDVEFVNSPGQNWGNSALSIHRFAQGAGYELVAATGMNLIFLDRQAAAVADLPSLDLSAVAPRQRWFWGYDGTLLRAGTEVKSARAEVMSVPWHTWRMSQPMPRSLRRWKLGGQPRRTERLVSELWLALQRPKVFLSRIFQRFDQP